jgi:hypothetical protein
MSSMPCRAGAGSAGVREGNLREHRPPAAAPPHGVAVTPISMASRPRAAGQLVSTGCRTLHQLDAVHSPVCGFASLAYLTLV